MGTVKRNDLQRALSLVATTGGKSVSWSRSGGDLYLIACGEPFADTWIVARLAVAGGLPSVDDTPSTDLGTLLGMVDAIDAEEVELARARDDGTLLLQAARARLKLPTSNAPSVSPAEGTGRTVTLRAADLQRLLDGCVAFAGELHAWSGIRIEVDASGAVLGTATDGTALVQVRCAGLDETPSPVAVTLPQRSARVIGRLISRVESDAPVRLGIGEAWVSVEVPDATARLRIIDAAFPDYASLLPDASDRYRIGEPGEDPHALQARLTVAVAPLIEAAQRVELVGTKRGGALFEFGAGAGIVVSVESDASGRDEVSAEVEGSATRLLTPAILVNVLRSLACDRVAIEVPHGLAAIVFRAPDAIALMMPRTGQSS